MARIKNSGNNYVNRVIARNGANMLIVSLRGMEQIC
jgi:hypothetical protein